MDAWDSRRRSTGTETRNERRERLERDFFGWCRHYLPHYFVLPPSKMHRELASDFLRIVNSPDVERFAFAAPRGNAKTTFLLAFLLWCIVYKRKRFIIFITSTAELADIFLGDIKAELEDNERLLEDFPEATGRGGLWRENAVVTRNGVRIQALGAGKKIRGRKHRQFRPDLVCHERGTEVFTEGRWMRVEQHPTARSRVCDGYRVRLWGLPFDEVVTPEHRYWGRSVRPRCGNRSTDAITQWGDPGWVEAQALRTAPRRSGWYIGLPIDLTEEPVRPLPRYCPGDITERDELGRVVSAGGHYEDVVPPEFSDPEWWWLFGFWWGNGTVGRGKNRWSVTLSGNARNVALRERLEQFFASRGIATHLRFDRGAFHIKFSHAVLARWFRDDWRFGPLQGQKRPPAWVERVGLGYQIALMRGYVDADGCSTKSEVRITSVSLPGLLSARRILARLGIPATIRDAPTITHEIQGKRIKHAQRKYDLRFAEQAHILGVEGVEYSERYEVRRTFIRDGYLWSKVRAVEPVEQREFVPIDTPSRDYLTHFGRSHNCVDDFEDDEHVRNLDQRDKQYAWLTKAVLKARGVAQKCDFLLSGTLLHFDSVLARMLDVRRNPGWRRKVYRAVISWANRKDLWDEWERVYTDWHLGDEERQAAAHAFYERNRSAMLEGTEVLWPEGEDYYDLMRQRIDDGPTAFQTEKQNEPLDPSQCEFPEDWFEFFDEVERAGETWLVPDRSDAIRLADCDVYGALDPSKGKLDKHGDPSALISIAAYPGQHLPAYSGRYQTFWVIDGDVAWKHPHVLEDRIFELHTLRRYQRFGIEAVQFQELLAELVQERALRDPAAGMLHIVKLTPISDKTLRIQKLGPYIYSTRLKLGRRHAALYDQLRYFPQHAHDDGPDGVELCLETIGEIGWVVVDFDRPDRERQEREKRMNQYDRQLAQILPEAYDEPAGGLTCGKCLHREPLGDGNSNGRSYCGLRQFRIRDADPACDSFDAPASG